MNAELKEYAIAARRKVQIAHYHCDMLAAMDIGEQGNGGAPIPVQAHFEGVLYAAIAAGDQIAELINQGYGLKIDTANLMKVIAQMPKSDVGRLLSQWHDAAIMVDARRLRRLGTHHHYEKTATGSERLEAQEVRGSQYQGSRALDDYAIAVVNHLDSFALFIDAYEGLFRG